MRKILICLLLCLSCQEQQTSIPEEEVLNLGKSLVIALEEQDSLTAAKILKKLQLNKEKSSVDAKTAFLDYAKMDQYAKRYLHDSLSVLSWNHVETLYKLGEKKAAIHYAYQKCNAELYIQEDSTLNKRINQYLIYFKELESECMYGQLIQLRATNYNREGYHSLALKEFKKLNNMYKSKGVCNDLWTGTQVEMAFLYSFIKLPEKGLECAKLAYEFSESNDNKALGSSLVARSYLELKQPKNSLKYALKALELGDIENYHMQNYYKSILIQTYADLQAHAKVDSMFLKKNSNEMMAFHEVLFLKAKARSLDLRGNLDEAIRLNLEALDLIPDLHLESERSLLKDIADLYGKKKNFEKAYYYQSEFLKHEDNYIRNQNKNRISEESVALKITEKEADIQLAKRKAVEQDLIITKKNRTIVVGSVVSVGLLLLILLFVIFYKRIQHKNLELASQKQKVEQANEALTLALEEKSMLMKEIHHRVKNHLQFLMCILRVQARANDISIEEFVDRSNARLTAIASIHQQLYEIQSEEKLSLKPYIVKLSTALQNMREIDYEFTVESEPEDIWLSNHLAVSVGLILNELISNSYKHAFQDQDNFIKILISAKEGRVTMVYRDSGKNSVHVDKLSKSSGIEIIKILAKQIHADITFNEYFNEVVFYFEYN
jgi:two-component sensor histidine kinase